MQATSNPSIPAPPSGGFFSPRNINRMLLVLGFLGIFDASLLSAEALFRLNLSCGVEAGCATIASDKSAFWFGVPVAYFGLAAYITFTALAAIRAILGVEKTKVLTYIGYAMAVFGALTSIYLQYVALVVIRAFCPYCFGSAVNMILTLILYAMLTSRIGALPPAVEVPDADSPYPRTESAAPGSSDASWVGVGLLATVVAVIFGGTYLQSKHKPPSMVPIGKNEARLLPLSNDVHGYGDPKAPIKITEFADLACIHCQVLTPKVHEFVDEHPGKVYAIWRQFPLRQVHPMAITAALVSEYAARHGKFWDYADKLFALGDEPKTWEQVSAPAAAIGLNLDDIKTEIQKVDSPEMIALHKDLDDGGYWGVDTTPTFFVQMQGEKTRIATAGDVFDVLSSPPFNKVLDKK